MALDRLGPYRLDKIIGRGGMGTVRAAQHTETGQRVAVKLLAQSCAQQDHFRQRFETEIQSLIKLDHPNIVRILAYDVEGEQMYYAMELVEGRSLFDEQRRGRRFEWREVARIGIETCAGLQHAHDRGILHRDLKPGNLMMEADGTIKLTDFGIAKLFGGRQLTADGGVIGTVDYMSPEQAKGEPTSARSDLYSLGSVLFALLARRPPFQEKTIPTALRSLSFDAPPPVRDFAPETPAEFEKIIDRLLAKTPADRIGSARSLAKRLESLLKETPADPEDHEVDLPDDPEDENSPRSKVGGNWDKPTTELPSAMSGRADADAQPTRGAPGSATRVTQQAESPAKSPPPIKTAGFTEVDDEVRQRHDDLGKPLVQRRAVWPLILGLLILVASLVFGIMYAGRPPSADQLWEKIQLAAGDEDADKVVTVEDECRDFLERFPQDPRAKQVRQTLSRIELLQYPRQLQRRRRMGGFTALSPAEQFYLAAMETSKLHPEQAIADLTALTDMFQDDPDADNSVRAARKQIAQLEEIIAQRRSKHAEVLEKQLDRARRMRQSDPSSVEKLLQGIIRLYADKPWAEHEVRQARELLDEHHESAIQP